MRLLPLLLLAACATPDDAPTTWTAAGDVYRVTVRSADPLVVGGAVLDVDVVALADEAPVVDATVTIDPAMPAHGHAVDPVVAAPLDVGTYEAEVFLPMAGGWELTVRVAGEGGTDAAVVPVEVR